MSIGIKSFTISQVICMFIVPKMGFIAGRTGPSETRRLSNVRSLLNLVLISSLLGCILADKVDDPNSSSVLIIPLPEKVPLLDSTSFSNFTIPLLISAALSLGFSSRKFVKTAEKKFNNLEFWDSVINLSRLIIGSAFASVPISISKCGLGLGFSLLLLSAITSFGGLYFYEETILLSVKKSGADQVQNIKRLTSTMIFSNELAWFHEVIVALKAFGVTTAYIASMVQLLGPSMEQVSDKGSFQLFVIAVLAVMVFKFADRWLDVYLSAIFIIVVLGAYFVLQYITPSVNKRVETFITIQTNSTEQNTSNSCTFSSDPIISDLQPYSPWKNFKLYLDQFALFVFAFTCHHNAFKIHNGAKKEILPNITKIMIYGVGLVFIYYAVISYSVCMTYSEELKTKTKISNSFDLMPDASASSSFCRLLYAFFILISYSPHAQSFADARAEICKMSNPGIGPKDLDESRKSDILNLVILNVAIVFFIHPDCVEIMKIVGSVLSTLICFVLPPFYYLIYPSFHKSLLKIIGAGSLLLFGLIILFGYFYNLWAQFKLLLNSHKDKICALVNKL